MSVTRPLTSLARPVLDEADKLVHLGGVDSPGQGSISLTLEIPSATFLLAGYALKKSKGRLGLGLNVHFNKKFFVLTKEKLTYFANSHSLQRDDKSVDCRQVTAVDWFADRAVLVVKYSKDSWEIKFIDGQFSRLLPHLCLINVRAQTRTGPRGCTSSHSAVLR